MPLTPKAKLPEIASAFLAHFIHSVEQLEILLLVSGRSEDAWTVSMVYDVILSTRPSVTGWLEDFVRQGLMTHGEAGYRYAPPNEEVRAAVNEVTELYRKGPVRIIEAIYSRDRTAQSFADAFKFKQT